MLPLLTEAVDAADAARVLAAVARYAQVFDRLDGGIQQGRSILQGATGVPGPPVPLGAR